MNSSKLLKNVRIVLLKTFHPGNIGAVARAMKTMGLDDLVLVNPLEFPHDEATRRAAGAADLLENANRVFSLEDAIADCTQVFAASARKKYRFNRPQKSCEQAVEWIKQHPNEKIAIVFGPERDGLSSDEISLCQQLLTIPGNPAYDTLNLASAVQIVSYELFKQLSPIFEQDNTAKANYATQLEVNGFFENLQNSLQASGFMQPQQPSDTMGRLRALVDRAKPTAKELAMLRGMVEALTRQ